MRYSLVFCAAAPKRECNALVLVTSACGLSDLRSDLIAARRASASASAHGGATTPSSSACARAAAFLALFHRDEKYLLAPPRGRAGTTTRLLADGRVRSVGSVSASPHRAVIALAFARVRVGPDLAFSSRLARLQSREAQLVAAGAWASTLGGGHFMCRHVPEAVSAALALERVACALENGGLARRARLHFVYIFCMVGRFRLARTLAQSLAADAALGGDVPFASLAHAATTHVTRARKLARAGTLAQPLSDSHADPYHRFRIVSAGHGNALRPQQ